MAGFNTFARFIVKVERMKDLDKLRKKTEELAKVNVKASQRAEQLVKSNNRARASANRLNTSNERLTNTNSRLASASTRLSTANTRVASTSTRVASANSRAVSSVSSLNVGVGSLVGTFGSLAAAIGAASLAQSLFNSTIKEAALAQFNKNAINHLLGPKEGPQMVQWLQEKSYNSMNSMPELFMGGQAFSPMLRDDPKKIKEAIQLAEQLQYLNMSQGYDGAVFSVREALSGDYLSVQERFNTSRDMWKRLKQQADDKGMEGASRNLWVLQQGLNKEMGIDDKYVKAQLDTAYGQYKLFANRVKGTHMLIGEYALEYLKPIMQKLNQWLTPEKMVELADKWGKRLAKVAKFMLDTVNNFGKIKAYLKGIWNEFVSIMSPVTDRLSRYRDLLKEVSGYLNVDVVPALKEFNKQLQDSNSTIGKVWQAVAPFATSLLVAYGAVKAFSMLNLGGLFAGMKGGMARLITPQAMNSLKSFIVGFALLSKTGGKGKAIFESLKILTKGGFIGALRTMGALLAKTPLTLLIAGLIELGFWMYNNQDKVTEFAQKAKEGFAKAWTAFIDWIQPLINVSKAAWAELSDFFGGYWKQFTDYFNGEGKVWVELFKSTFADLKFVFDEFSKVTTGSLGYFFAGAKFLFTAGLGYIVFLFKSSFIILVETIKWFWKVARAVLTLVFDSILSWFKVWGHLMNGEWAKAWEEFKNLWLGIVVNAWGIVKAIFTGMYTWMLNIFENVATEGIKFINKLLQGLIVFATDVWTTFEGTWQNLSETIKAPFKKAFDWIETKYKEVLNTMKNTEIGMPKWAGGNGFIQQKDGTHRFGLANVPFNGYRAELHKGERVLTARENKEYDQMKYSGASTRGGITIAKLADHIVIREDADIDKLATALAREIDRAAMAGA